jgi:hypothetical protein
MHQKVASVVNEFNEDVRGGVDRIHRQVELLELEQHLSAPVRPLFIFHINNQQKKQTITNIIYLLFIFITRLLHICRLWRHFFGILQRFRCVLFIQRFCRL